jgi:hypothetical protein
MHHSLTNAQVRPLTRSIARPGRELDHVVMDGPSQVEAIVRRAFAAMRAGSICSRNTLARRSCEDRFICTALIFIMKECNYHRCRAIL